LYYPFYLFHSLKSLCGVVSSFVPWNAIINILEQKLLLLLHVLQVISAFDCIWDTVVYIFCYALFTEMMVINVCRFSRLNNILKLERRKSNLKEHLTAVIMLHKTDRMSVNNITSCIIQPVWLIDKNAFGTVINELCAARSYQYIWFWNRAVWKQ
jgi:hypothetical protein